MNLVRRWPLRQRKLPQRVSIHQKTSPPKKDDLYEVRPERNHPARIQRDIFGATILPQNLSYENSKKLTNNEVNLGDIPIIDEDDAAEVMMAGKLRSSRAKVRRKRSEEFMVTDAVLTRDEKVADPPFGELFYGAHPFEDIPGPKVFPDFFDAIKNFTRQVTVASLFRFLKRNNSVLFRAYGPIVRLPDILGGKIVLVARLEDISAVFRQDPRHRSAFDSVRCARSLQWKKDSPGDSDEEWENVRNAICDPPLKEPEKYFEVIDEASGKFLRRVKEIRNAEDEVPDDFLFEINRWGLECLCQVIFEKSFGFLDYDAVASSESSQLLDSLSAATKNLCGLETGFQLWRLVNTYSMSSLSLACSTLQDVIAENVTQVQADLIRRHGSGETSSGRFSLLEGLLLQSDSTPDDAVGRILDVLLIGTNTVSVAVGFLLYHLSRNPRCQAELWKEIKIALPEKYSRLEYDQLRSLKYLRACLKESLRLKMPMPVLSRVLSNNVILGNYHIPKGTFILMASQMESMREERFAEPEKFMPERWIHQEDDFPLTLLPARTPFERRVESLLAEVSAWVCVSHLFRHFSVDYCHEEIEATTTTISFPDKPLKLTFIDRED